MELLLLKCHRVHYAIEMKQVSRIIKMNSIGDKKKFLYEPANEEFGVLLTNNLILPVEHVEQMIHHDGSAVEPNDFLKGCMKDKNIDGFVTINNNIYGMLNQRFLKFTDPGNCPAGTKE